MSDAPPSARKAVFLNAADLPFERFDDPRLGSVGWYTIFSADRTDTSGMCCGLAMLDQGQSLNLHHHGPAEIYFGVSGTTRVEIDGETFRLTPGTAVFIPEGATHGAFADEGPTSFFYVFAVSDFNEVDYHVLAPAIEILAETDPPANDPGPPDEPC